MGGTQEGGVITASGAWLLCNSSRHELQGFLLDKFYGSQENHGKTLIYTL